MLSLRSIPFNALKVGFHIILSLSTCYTELVDYEMNEYPMDYALKVEFQSIIVVAGTE